MCLLVQVRSRGFQAPTRNGVVPLKLSSSGSGGTDSRHQGRRKSNDLEGFFSSKRHGYFFPGLRTRSFAGFMLIRTQSFCFLSPWLHESRPWHKDQTEGSPWSILKADSLDTQHLLFPKQKAVGFSTGCPSRWRSMYTSE